MFEQFFKNSNKTSPKVEIPVMTNSFLNLKQNKVPETSKIPHDLKKNNVFNRLYSNIKTKKINENNENFHNQKTVKSPKDFFTLKTNYEIKNLKPQIDEKNKNNVQINSNNLKKLEFFPQKRIGLTTSQKLENHGNSILLTSVRKFSTNNSDNYDSFQRKLYENILDN